MKFFLDNWWLILAAFLSGAGILWPAIQRGFAGGGLSPSDATRLVNDKNAVLLDVRAADEFGSGHIVGAKNLPLDELTARAGEVHKSKTHPVIVVCGTGRRAAKAAAQLKTAGYTDVAVLDGGITAWHAAGLPLKKTM